MPDTHGEAEEIASLPESRLLVRQVETHLIFGPLSRRFPLASLALAGGIVSLVRVFLPGEEPLGRDILDTIGNLSLPLGGFLCWYFLRRLSLIQQAIAGWVAVKSTGGLICFLLMTSAVPMYFFQGDPNAWPVLFLGLIWMPGLEFIPRLTPRQRYITLMRIVLSVPCLYIIR